MATSNDSSSNESSSEEESRPSTLQMKPVEQSAEEDDSEKDESTKAQAEVVSEKVASSEEEEESAEEESAEEESSEEESSEEESSEEESSKDDLEQKEKESSKEDLEQKEKESSKEDLVEAAKKVSEEEESAAEDRNGEESCEEDESSKEDLVEASAKKVSEEEESAAEDSNGEESCEEEVPSKKAQICVSGKRRLSEGQQLDDMIAAKKQKTKLVPQQFWTAEDGVRLLEGVLQFRSPGGKSYLQDKDGFYQSIKGSFSVDVSFAQCLAKIASIRKKYRKKQNKGERPSALKPLDLKAFELYEKIWGKGTNAAQDSRSDGIQKQDVDGDWFSNYVLFPLVADHGMGGDAVKMAWAQVPDEKKREMMHRWSTFKAKEDETFLLKKAFSNDIVSLICR